MHKQENVLRSTSKQIKHAKEQMLYLWNNSCGHWNSAEAQRWSSARQFAAAPCSLGLNCPSNLVTPPAIQDQLPFAALGIKSNLNLKSEFVSHNQNWLNVDDSMCER